MLTEATRLAVSQAAVGRMVKAMLMKTMFLQRESSGVDCIVAAARNPMDRFYSWSAPFEDVFPGGEFVPMAHAGMIPHRTMSCDVVATKRRWLEVGHPWIRCFSRSGIRTSNWPPLPRLAGNGPEPTRNRVCPWPNAETANPELPGRLRRAATGHRRNAARCDHVPAAYCCSLPVNCCAASCAARWLASLAYGIPFWRHSACAMLLALFAWESDTQVKTPPDLPFVPDDGQIEPAAARDALRSAGQVSYFDTRSSEAPVWFAFTPPKLAPDSAGPPLVYFPSRTPGHFPAGVVRR